MASWGVLESRVSKGLRVSLGKKGGLDLLALLAGLGSPDPRETLVAQGNRANRGQLVNRASLETGVNRGPLERQDLQAELECPGCLALKGQLEKKGCRESQDQLGREAREAMRERGAHLEIEVITQNALVCTRSIL